MKTLNLLLAILLSAVAGQAASAVAVFDFSNLTYQSGTGFSGYRPNETLSSGYWNCTKGDICSSNIDKGKFGGDLKYVSSGVDVTATGWYKGKIATVVQDHDNKYDAAKQLGAGLGVYHKEGDPSDDNVTTSEKLVMKFDRVVKLEGLSLRSEGHDINHWTPNATFKLNGASTKLAGVIDLGSNNLVGQEFTFEFGGAKADQFYLAGMTVSPVPEPETYAMMLSGLAVMGFVARRRRDDVACDSRV
ncbi:MAG: hypothetical protein V7606_2305 [Burkholderiales bacterium]